MIYIVSGFMRTGTSMMMRALEAGGMEAAYSQERDKRMNERWGEPDTPAGYVPNDHYYELDPENYQSEEFPQAYEGKLIKCLWGGLLRLPVGEYRIVFMRRNVQEIRKSLVAFFGQPHRFAERHDFDEQMNRIINIIKDRRSIKSVNVLNYTDVLANPLKEFSSLDWPVDSKKAAKIPKKSKRRQR